MSISEWKKLGHEDEPSMLRPYFLTLLKVSNPTNLNGFEADVRCKVLGRIDPALEAGRMIGMSSGSSPMSDVTHRIEFIEYSN